MPQQAGFSYQGSIEHLGDAGLLAGSGKKPPKPVKVSMSKILEKKDKINALPPESRALVLDRLYDKVGFDVKIKDPEGKAWARKYFEGLISGNLPEPLSGKPTESDYKAAGMSTGAFGKLKSGMMHGLGNLTDLAGNISKYGSGLSPFLGDESLNQIKKAYEPPTAAMHQTGDVLSEASSAYAGRHPFKAGAAELTGQALPSVPIEMMLPGSQGLGLGGKVALNAFKGGVGMMPFDPSTKGAATGAAFGALGTLGGAGLKKVFGRGASKITSKAAPVATAATSKGAELPPNVAGLADINKIAMSKFGKGITELTSDQRVEAVKEWKAAAIKEQNAAKAVASQSAKAAKAAKAQETIKTAQQSAESKGKMQAAMDEAKRYQRLVSQFVKEHRRAPEQGEMADLRARAAAGEEAPARGGTYIRTEPKPGFGTAKVPIEERVGTPEGAAADTVFYQRAKEMMGPDASVSDTLKKAQELKTTQFKAESPEVVKAVSAVADIRNVVTQVPEGEHGTGPIAQRAKDAERVAAARAKAAAEAGPSGTVVGTAEEGMSKLEAIASKAATPEQHMVALDEAYDYLTRHIEGGKQLAGAFKTAAKMKKWDSETTLNSIMDYLEERQKGVAK